MKELQRDVVLAFKIRKKANMRDMTVEYRPKGVCARAIKVDTENGIIKNVIFVGGCPGSLEGISRLVKGMPADEAIARLEGIRCAMKRTSCPDQLARALKKPGRE